MAWRDELLYEYYWEWNFPHTPTTLGLRTDRYKYIFRTNDIDELYDHDSDPYELRNVAQDPRYASDLEGLKNKIVNWMAKTQDHLYNEWIVYWLTDDMQLAAKAPGRTGTPW